MKPRRPQRNTPGPPKPVVTVSEYSLKDITEKIISCATEVHSSLGPERLENLYEEALEHYFRSRDIDLKRQKELEVKYKCHLIGNYRADCLIEDKEPVESKCMEAIKNIHIAQVLTCLKAGNLRVGLWMNFDADKLKHGIKRVIL